VVTRSASANGVRLRFDSMAPSEHDNLRQFLKYVQESTSASHGNRYMRLLK